MWEEDNDNTNINQIKLNKNFAQKFEHRKKREELEKAKQKHGRELNRMLEDEQSFSESSSSSEDEEGELLNDKERVNFIKTIAKIREKDPEIYKNDKAFWNDDIFDKEEAGSKKEKQNPIYYKDLARQALTEENKPKKTVRELHDEEQAKLKNAFKQAAEIENDDDGLFKVKTKTQQQIEDENKEFEKFIKTESKKSKPEEVDMLQRFWGDETKLDDTDKFLRKYILTNGWIDKDKDQFNFDEADEEDDRRDEEMDQFEETYNFRFEEPGADQVVTYGREIQDSVRQTNDKRKEKRKEKEERKKEELQREKEDLKRLKNIMKQEVLDRLKKVQEIAGSELAQKEKFNKLLDKDFDPNDYDQLMNEEFGEEYYDNEDEKEQELEEYVEEREKQYDEIPEENNGEEAKKEEDAPKNGKQAKSNTDKDVLEPKAAIPIYNRVGIKEAEAKEIADAIGHLWWYCDTCFRGIKEGEARFECLECQDFCQCKQCGDMREHPHKMKKFIVPQGCAPPSDKEIQKILNDTKFCAECNYKFTEYDFIYELKKNKEFLLCDDCIKNNQKQYKEKDFNKIKPTKVDTENLGKDDIGKLKDIFNDQELHNLIDSYYALDFEDVISGGLKTRFKYVNVGKNAYGLTDEELLYADDKKLNQFVSLKTIMPYKDDDKVNMKARSRVKQEVKKDAERNMRDVTKDIKKISKLENSGLSKKEIEEEKKHINHVRKMIDKNAKKKKVKLLSENDSEGLDDEDDEPVVEEDPVDLEPEKSKKRKLNSSRLKSYGLE